MFFKQRYDHTADIFKNYKLLKLNDIINLQTNLFVHRSIYLSPIDPGFTFMPTNTTRRSRSLRIPLCRTSHAQQSVLFRGAKGWNNLPDEFQSIENLNPFKSNLLKTIFMKYNE